MIIHSLSQVECFSRIGGWVVWITFVAFQPINNVFRFTLDFTVDVPLNAVLCFEGLTWLNIEITQFASLAVAFEKSIFVIRGMLSRCWCGRERRSCDLAEEVFGLPVCLDNFAVTKHLL